jgi:hypothetical protein
MLTETNEQDCFRPHIIGQYQHSLSDVMLNLRPFSLDREYPGTSYRLERQASGPT